MNSLLLFFQINKFQFPDILLSDKFEKLHYESYAALLTGACK